MVLGFKNGADADHDGLRRHRRSIFFGMASLSTVIKRDLSAMGKFLFVGAIMLLVGGIANFFLQSTAPDDHAARCWPSASSRPSCCTT